MKIIKIHSRKANVEQVLNTVIIVPNRIRLPIYLRWKFSTADIIYNHLILSNRDKENAARRCLYLHNYTAYV